MATLRERLRPRRASGSPPSAKRRQAVAEARVAARRGGRATGPRRLSRSCSGTSQAERERTLARLEASATPSRRSRRRRRRLPRPTRRSRASTEIDRRVEEARAADPGRGRPSRRRGRAARGRSRGRRRAESHETAVRLETEIERRVMEGTEEVRREAEESVRKLVEKVEREAEEVARARAEEQLQAESDRIRSQAERREERARAGHRGRDQGQRQPGQARGPGGGRRDGTDLAARASRPPRPPATGPSRRESASLAPRDARGADQGHAEREPRALDPAGEVGIYACGPTVYSRIHIGNARPFVVFSLFARFLRSEGYRDAPGRQRHRHQRQDLRRGGEAGEASAEFAAAMTARLLRGHRPARARPARRRAAGDRDDRRRSSR